MGSLAEQQACLEPVAPWGEGPPDREEQTLTEVLTQELYLAYMTVYEQGCGSLPDDLSSEAQHHNLFYQKSQVFVFSSSSRPFGECLDSEVSRPVRRQGLWWGLKMVTALQGPVSVSEMEKNLHPEFLAKQVSTAARGSPALLLSGDSSLCDHTLCCWKRKLQERVDKGIETDGSNLSGVSAKCAWDDLSRPPEDDEDSRSICIGTQPRRLSGKDTEQIRETLRRGLEINSKPVLPPINPQRQNGLTHDRAPSRKDSLESDSSTAIIPHELIRTRQLESVHLKFNQESGALIPLCLRGRLLHGRHFTYKSITGDMAITFVSTGVEGAFATEEHPYAAHGPWLQILLTEEFVEKMLEDLEDLTSPEEFKLPKEYSWPEKKLKVSILPDVVFDSPLH
ncbi:suppressor of fused homolog isoform X3 [Balaenoptera acutorostrata]|uniref:Suppressor of fused homolog n=1 Tax=Balaenoptera acutorostrata TaxID=9767 RepID=A0A384AIX2_BALAC|nr:suppressor of fused homolog isoform X3 [Balaenoptera acutorostrata]